MNKAQKRNGKKRPEARGEAAVPVVQGFKYGRLVGKLLRNLQGAGGERDRAGNRQLVYDPYATLLVLYFFTPPLTRLRGVQQVSTWAQVQQRWGVPRPALGTLREAATLFDATLLQDVISELAGRAWTQAPTRTPALLKGAAALLRELVALAGSLLPAVPRLGWAVWPEEPHRAAKLHVAFAARRPVPVGVRITAGKGAERPPARQLVHPGGVYVFDRGSVDYDLGAELPALPCRFGARVKEGAAYEGEQERPLTGAAAAAGVTRDVTLRRLGSAPHRPWGAQPLRVVRVTTDKRHPDRTPVEMGLVTTQLELDADLRARAYRYRWTVELFFRWCKCILGCRPLLSHRENGVQLQVYMALSASLLSTLGVGRTPTKRTYELLCFYLSGWASTTEVMTHIDRLHLAAPPSKE
jgi:hypothetical protein